MKNGLMKLLFVVGTAFVTLVCPARDVIPLDGEWRIVVDPSANRGHAEKWYENILPLHETAYPKGLGHPVSDVIELPGSLDRAGIGRHLRTFQDAENVIPKRYKGAFWLEKHIDFSSICSGEAVINAVLPQNSELYFDGKKILSENDCFTVNLTKGQHRILVFVAMDDDRKMLDEFSIECDSRMYILDGEWRIVPELHSRAYANRWITSGIDAPKDLYTYYASYFRGADYIKQDYVELPFSLAESDVATLVNPLKSITQGLERKLSYDGAFWVQRTVTIPENWNGAYLKLERAVGVSECYWDGKKIGEQHGYDVPQRFAIPVDCLAPGEHTLTVFNNRSDKSWPQTGHGIKSENGTNWCGILGEIAVIRNQGISNLQIYPDIESNAISVSLETQGGDRVVFAYRQKGKSAFIDLGEFEVRNGKYEMALPKKAKLWDEFTPDLYELSCTLMSGSEVMGRTVTTFGMREIGTDGMSLLLNGHPVFLRGVQQCGANPIENVTPMDREYWDRIMSITKEYGMNHVRFHSWCPPKAAFEAADEYGIIFQIELPHDDIKGADKVPGKELVRILDEYGNHPSFCLITLGNERFTHNDVSREVIRSGKRHDPRHLYACTTHPIDNHCIDDFYVSAWGINNLQPNGWGRPVTGIEWGGGDVVTKSRFNTECPNTLYDYRTEVEGCRAPVLTHEVGQWAMYPNLRLIDEYTGVLRNTNYERIRDKAEENGLLNQTGDFARASGKFSALLYKEEIESVLRTPNLAGFSLLGINDFPGQHLSVVGILDEFWNSKNLVTPEFHSMYAGAVVPLVRLEKRIWMSDEMIRADVEIANYGPVSLDRPVSWSINNESGERLASGKLNAKSVGRGCLGKIGSIETNLNVKNAQKLTLSVKIQGTEYKNSWNIWVYPNKDYSGTEGKVMIADRWSDEIKDVLSKGATVLLVPAKETLKDGYRDGCFTTIFWNSIFKWLQRNHTHGILCNPEHHAFASFPTDEHSDWQWWDIMMNSNAMYMNKLPHEIKPIIQAIDSYTFNNRLAYLWECKVGNGRLMVSTIDFMNNMSDRPSSELLKSSVLNYMNSQNFNPEVELTPEEIDAIFE